MYKKIYRNMCFMAMTSLIIFSVLVLCACYTYFDNQQKEELANEAKLAAEFLNLTDSPMDSLNKIETKNSRITYIGKNGKIIYDNKSKDGESRMNRPEIEETIEKGFSSVTRFSRTTGKTMHYCAVLLDNGEIIRLSRETGMPSVFYTILIVVLFITALLYILCAIVATRLTDSIVNPIEKIDISNKNAIDNAYEEIQPFLRKIANQNIEISRQVEKVIEQKARLRAIMDNINEGLVITDGNGYTLSVNNPAMDILSISEDNIRRKHLTELTKDEKIHSVLRKALAGEKNNIMFESRERSYQIFYSPVYEENQVSGSVLLLFDVTERTNNEKIRREFTANVSHELKTPLTTIHGYSQIIDSGIAKPEDIEGFIKKIEKESSRLMVLVDDIIALSHLDEDTGDSPKELFFTESAVAEAFEALAEKAKEKEIEFTYTCDHSQIYANMAQVVEMTYNLCDNAIKYTNPQGKVNISAVENKIIVSDTGMGIPEKYHDRIFERFFRVDKSHSKKVNGTGLGLSIVKHLAKINNAEIDVKSVSGKGSTFTLTFRKDVDIEGNF